MAIYGSLDEASLADVLQLSEESVKLGLKARDTLVKEGAPDGDIDDGDE